MPRTCEECREKIPEITRQSYRCAFAPLAPESLRQFVRIPVPSAYSGPELTECSGYTTSLPEVIEAARAWRHWDNADVRVFTGGPWPTDPLVIAIEEFDAAVNAHQRWCADNPVKKD